PLGPPPATADARVPERRTSLHFLTPDGPERIVAHGFPLSTPPGGIRMPRHKSAAKRVITNAKRRVRNIAATTRMRSAIRQVRSSTTRGQAEAAYRQATAILDRTAAK